MIKWSNSAWVGHPPHLPMNRCPVNLHRVTMTLRKSNMAMDPPLSFMISPCKFPSMISQPRSSAGGDCAWHDLWNHLLNEAQYSMTKTNSDSDKLACVEWQDPKDRLAMHPSSRSPTSSSPSANLQLSTAQHSWVAARLSRHFDRPNACRKSSSALSFGILWSLLLFCFCMFIYDTSSIYQVLHLFWNWVYTSLSCLVCLLRLPGWRSTTVCDCEGTLSLAAGLRNPQRDESDIILYRTKSRRSFSCLCTNAL